MVATNANGSKIPNGSDYFWRMDNGEIILDAPVFDYFYLESFDKVLGMDVSRCLSIYRNNCRGYNKRYFSGKPHTGFSPRNRGYHYRNPRRWLN